MREYGMQRPRVYALAMIWRHRVEKTLTPCPLMFDGRVVACGGGRRVVGQRGRMYEGAQCATDPQVVEAGGGWKGCKRALRPSTCRYK